MIRSETFVIVYAQKPITVPVLNIRINSAVTAIVMTSLFTPEADLRYVNWIKSLLMPFRHMLQSDLSLLLMGKMVYCIQSRILFKYCFCLKSGAVLVLNLLSKTFILPTYFDFSEIHMHYNCAMAAILMTSLCGPDAELRWAN